MNADLALWQEIVLAVFLVFAGIFGLVGSYGLIKLPDPMTRLHAPTKATTLGIGSALFASVLFFAVAGDFSVHEVLIVFFLFLTAPITAHFVAKAHLHQRREQALKELPPTGSKCGWATFDPAPGSAEGELQDQVDERG